jgi:hypothetical protein
MQKITLWRVADLEWWQVKYMMSLEHLTILENTEVLKTKD